MGDEKGSVNCYKLLFALTGVVVAIVIPWLLPAYWRDILVLFVINVILVMSYRLIVSMGGWSFAHIATMAVGAYTLAFLSSVWLNLSFWLVLPIGGLLAALFAFAISYAVLRTKLFYFFLSTFAAGEALRQCFINFQSLGGFEGFSFIKRPEPLLVISFENTTAFYYLVLVIAAISGLVLHRVDRSRIGRTIRAVGANESLSESLGMHAWAYRAAAFVGGSFFAGIAGVLFCSYNGFAAPTDYNASFMYTLIASAIVGGTGTLLGPILGLFVLTMLRELLRSFHIWVPLFYGMFIIVVLLFVPGGLERLVRSIVSILLSFKKKRTRNNPWRGKIPASEDEPIRGDCEEDQQR
jgi:branched-chain amino acid transport system permease protein